MRKPFAPGNPERFKRAIRRFDQENSQDPNLQVHGSESDPRELVYAKWLTEWVLRLEPDASEALRLATRGAHLCRWSIARNSYPLDRAGYLRWRQELKKFHEEKAAAILDELGYEQETIAQVRKLISKRGFPTDPESRTLEDALCLVFLEHQFADLAAKSSDDKMINALRKTWKKMTPRAREIAKGLGYGSHERDLLERALAD